MEIPSIQLSLEHIEELDFTCPAAKKSINIGKEIIPVKFVVNIYPDVKRDYFKLITGMLALRTQNTVFKNYPLPLINVSEILTSMNITDSEGIGENLNIYYNN